MMMMMMMLYEVYYVCYYVGLEAWITLQKSKTAVKALLRDVTVQDHQPNAVFPKVRFYLLARPRKVWRGGVVVRTSDLQPRGCTFEYWPLRTT